MSVIDARPKLYHGMVQVVGEIKREQCRGREGFLEPAV
jgi:hypothetical protein